MSPNSPGPAVCRACGAALSPSASEGICPKCLLERVLKPKDLSDANATVQLESSVPSSPFTGTRLRYFGDYELLEEIARGGMGIVFKARQINLNRLVALKLINSGALASQEIVKRFKAEAEAAAALNHPNIVPIYEIGEVQGQHYFSMGLVQGRNLDEYLEKKPLPAREAAQLVLTLAHAVHHAHQHGVLHRDIKPSNVLADESGTPYLTDFGLAKLAQKDSTLTHTNVIMGTPSYMAPEQARGDAKRVTTAADVYGLGAVFYTCLTGRPPFAGGTTFETIRLVLEGDAQAPSKWNHEIDRDLETVCLKCLSKDPAQRYSSAEALAVDLGHWLNSEPIEARPATAYERLQKWVRRRPTIAALSALSFVLLAAMAVGGTIYSLRLNAAAKTMEEQLYAAEMGVAFAAWERGNSTLPHELLETNRPGQRQMRDLRGFEWHYLNALCTPRELFTFPKRTEIYGLACSPDGRLVAAGLGGAGDATIRLVDIVSRSDVGVLQPRPASGAAYAIAFDPPGKRLISTTSSHVWDPVSKKLVYIPGGFVQVWDLEQKSIITNLVHSFGTIATAFSPDARLIISSAGRELYSRAHPGELILWSGSTYEKLHAFSEHHAVCWETIFSPDGRLLATGHVDGAVVIWDVETRKTVRTFQAHAGIVSALAFSPDGTWLASGSMDEGISLWTIPEFSQVPLGRHERVDCVAFSRDGRWLASSARDQTIKLWNVAARTNKPIVLRGHTGRIVTIDFTPDGHRLISGSVDGTIKLWDWQTVTHQAQSPVETMLGPIFSRDSKLNLSENAGKTSVLRVSSETVITNLPITSAVFSPDGQTIAGLAQGHLEIFDQVTFQRLAQISSTPLSDPILFSPDGTSLLVRRSRNVVELRNPARQWAIEGAWDLSASDKWLNSFAFSHDGRYLAATCSNGSVALFDVRENRPFRELRRPGLIPRPIAWIPRSQILAIGSMETLVHLWNIATGTIQELKPGAGNTWALAASPDGKTLAIGTQDGFIKLINLATFREVATLRGHLTNIIGLSFSPDGSMLVSIGTEGSRLWSAREIAAGNLLQAP